MSKEQILLQTCHKKQFWSLTYLFITMYHVNREKLGIIGHLGHFEIVAAENGEKPKSGISITQSLLLTVLPYLPQNNCFWGWEILKIGENSYSAMTVFQNQRWLPIMANGTCQYYIYVKGQYHWLWLQNMFVLHKYHFEITITDLNMLKQTSPGSFVSIDGKLGC